MNVILNIDPLYSLLLIKFIFGSEKFSYRLIPEYLCGPHQQLQTLLSR